MIIYNKRGKLHARMQAHCNTNLLKLRSRVCYQKSHYRQQSSYYVAKIVSDNTL